MKKIPPIPSINFEKLYSHSQIPQSGSKGLVPEIKEICNKWKNIRESYPGWVIAPKQNRDVLWDFTNYWIRAILLNIDKVKSPNNFKLIYELNWRLETSLVPYFDDQIIIVKKVISNYNPFPSSIKFNDLVLLNHELNKEKIISSNDIANEWVEIIFSLIKVARQDHKTEDFQNLMKIIEKIKDSNSEWNANYYYQYCLYYLEQSNILKVSEILSKWPELKEEHPFWDAKKASILAEIGEFEKAERIAIDSLNEIRKRQSNKINYEFLSQEGWVILLLRNLLYRNWNYNYNEMIRFAGRLEELSNYNCNPENELRSLQSLIKINPVEKKTYEVNKLFDKHSQQVIRYSSSGIYYSNDIPYFAFLKLFEETCLPVRIGNVNFYSDPFFNCCRKIEKYSPIWAINIIIRTADEKKMEEYFTRIFIANINKNEERFIYDYYSLALIQAVDSINSVNYIYYSKIIFSLSEVLSRISIRLSEVDRFNIIEIAKRMYHNSFIRNDFRLYNSVKVMFKRPIQSMSNKELVIILPDLLNLPIPEGNDLHGDNWPEPFLYIKFDDDYSVGESIEHDLISSKIKSLIELVEVGLRASRSRAINRLVILFSIGALTKKESDEFKKALWSRTDSTTGLPIDTNLLDFSFLHLYPNNVDSILTFKKKILKNKIPSIIKKQKDGNGKILTRKISGGASESYLYLDNILGATIPLFQKKKTIDTNFIDWTEKDAVNIFYKLKELWDEEKQYIKDANLNDDFTDVLVKSFNLYDDLFSRVIIPRIREKNKKLIKDIKNIVKELKEKNLNFLNSVIAIQMVTKNDDKLIDLNELLINVNSIYENKISNASNAIYLGIVYNVQGKLDFYKEKLKKQLIEIMVSRRQPGLYYILIDINRISEFIPEVFNENDLWQILCSLEYLYDETSYPSKIELIYGRRSFEIIKYEDIPDYRQLSSLIAFHIYLYCISKKRDIPSIIKTWKEDSIIDPLPEIRNVWLNFLNSEENQNK